MPSLQTGTTIVDENTTQYTTEELVSTYIKIRDEIQETKKKADQKIAELEEYLSVVANGLLDICKAQGANSISTDKGTVMRTVKSKYWTSDWQSIYSFIKEHNAFELLEKRLHQSNMKSFLEENPDTHPPGLNVEREYAVTVRRK